MIATDTSPTTAPALCPAVVISYDTDFDRLPGVTRDVP
jgi:hypothetical protein